MNDIDILTGSRGWGANPQDYNALNSLSFGVDGFGRLVLGYGQTILAMLRYRFEIPRPGILSLTFVAELLNEFVLEHGRLSKALIEAEHGTARELNYVLRTGEFRGQMNMGSERGPFTYHFRAALTFDRAPYSETTVRAFGHQAGMTDYTYYAHPLQNESAATSLPIQNAG